MQLHAGDMLEQPVDVAPGADGVPRRGPGLLIGVVVVAAIAAGAGIWYGLSSHEKPTTEVPPTRNETQLAPAGTAQPGTVPANAANPIPAQAPSQAAVPAAPAQPAQQPTAASPSAVPAAKPASTGPAGAPHAAEPAATSAPSTGKATARKPKRRGGGAAGPRVPGEASEDVAAAREALRSLESGPVMKVKPSEEAPPSDDSEPLAPPEAPEPPPPAPE